MKRNYFLIIQMKLELTKVKFYVVKPRKLCYNNKAINYLGGNT